MPREFRQYPDPPTRQDGTPDGPDPRTDPGFYQVVQKDEVVAAYDSAHYPSLEAVILDLLDRGLSRDVAGDWGEDYHIWRDGRPLGMIPRRGVAPAPGPDADPAG